MVMSSVDEVAELEEAINSHANSLIDSWAEKKREENRLIIKKMEDTLELLADPELTPSLENLVSNFVKRDKAKRQFGTNSLLTQQESLSPLKKSLPRSILAAVQKFESPTNHQESPKRSLSPSPNFFQNAMKQCENEKSFNIPINFSHQSPSSHQFNIKNYDDKIESNPSSPPPYKRSTSREHHIPIERIEENEKNKLGVEVLPSNRIHMINVNLKSPISQVSPNPFLDLEKNANLKSPMSPLSPAAFLDLEESVNLKSPMSPLSQGAFLDLEKEEERLVHALRIGQEIPIHLEKENGVKGQSSRIAFAKERIRQSQENPLTQQRLELQKKLPMPSSNLAAAIAVQQGKNKFEGANGERVHHHSIILKNEPNELNNEKNRQIVHKFGPGSSVADRVQQFEKYPSHMMSHFMPFENMPPQHNLHAFHNNFHNNINFPSSFNTRLPTSPLRPPKEITHLIKKENPVFHEPLPKAVHIGDPPPYGETVKNNKWAGESILPIKIQYESHPPHKLKLEKGGVEVRSKNSSPLVAPWRNNSQSPLKPAILSSSKPIPKKGIDVIVPRFYWPQGKSPPTPYNSLNLIETELSKIATNSLSYEQFAKILPNLHIPLYWKKLFWTSLGLSPFDTVQKECFKKLYTVLHSSCSDESSRFLRLLWTASAASKHHSFSQELKLGNALSLFPIDIKRAEVTMADFVPMIQDIVDTHPGLGFLREAPEFHSRYVTTVISRIFYKVNRSWTGRMTLSELRRSNLLRIIVRLEEETDVNNITEYFSYEHFYVIYCKFWELDRDHDLLIDKNDLLRHNDQSLSSSIVDRIFSGTVLRGWDINSTSPRCSPGKMTYSDFVWFIISEEDKKTPTAIEYWFRCLDLDGDGILSPYEIQFFYKEQESRIECLGIEPLDFSNVYCQMVDMLRCSPKGVRLKDLKKNATLATNFFNTLFNLEKYLDHEQRDPFAAGSSSGGVAEFTESGDSDWDKYAAAEYELLIEEPHSDNMHESSDIDLEDLNFNS